MLLFNVRRFARALFTMSFSGRICFIKLTKPEQDI